MAEYDSSRRESIVSIEELREYDFIVNYENLQLPDVDHAEQIYSTFLNEETEYVLKLEGVFKEVEKLQASGENNFYFEPLNAFSRIDTIYYYHRAQFLPELRLATNLDEILTTFFKHKSLLYYYEDFLRTVPFLKWMLREVPLMKDLFQDKDCILAKRLDKYKDMLMTLKTVSTASEDRVQNAVELIIDTIRRGHLHYKRDFPAAELIVTEMKYINRLQDTLDAFKKYVFEKSDKYSRQKQKLYGKLPEIRVKQIEFLKSLENCLYDFNIIDIMDSFIKHKPLFELYVEDRKLKSQDVLAACLEEFEDLKYITDVTLDRLFKYPQFFEKFKKIHKDDEYAVAKIVEVDEIFYKIQHDANNVIAIESIIDSNINVEDQGILLHRGSLKVTSEAPVMRYYNKTDCVLFLFEKALIFTRENSENVNKEYVYLFHIVTSSIKLNAATNKEIQLTHTKSKTRSDMFKLSGKEEDVKKWEKKLVELIKKLITEKNKFYNRQSRA